MSDNNPSPTENPEADSFLGRLSVVVFYLVMAGALVTGVLTTRPGTWASASQIRFELIVSCAEFGWVSFLTIVYLAGRYYEVLGVLAKALGVNKTKKIDRPISFSDGALFWLLPLLAYLFSSVCFGIIWRIPDGIRWVGELFRG
jgi:hypothetical protein